MEGQENTAKIMGQFSQNYFGRPELPTIDSASESVTTIDARNTD